MTAVSDSGSTYSIKTDSTGTFNLKGLPASPYSLSASRSDFLPYDKTTHSTGVSLAPGQQLKELRIRLTPTGSIAGRVLAQARTEPSPSAEFRRVTMQSSPSRIWRLENPEAPSFGTNTRRAFSK